MKYRTKGVRLGHKLFNRVRVTEFDKERFYVTDRSYSFTDHTQMKSHEYAAFQKRLFQQRKKDQKREKWIYVISAIVTIILIVGFLWYWEFLDFEMLFSSNP
tara:strand:+ start:222 stop:527 length:306 start_codon:yes stop_codon:yes gene_type:complete